MPYSEVNFDDCGDSKIVQRTCQLKIFLLLFGSFFQPKKERFYSVYSMFLSLLKCLLYRVITRGCRIMLFIIHILFLMCENVSNDIAFFNRGHFESHNSRHILDESHVSEIKCC